MPLDPGAVGATAGPVERAWSSTDCLLYALAVGAGPSELAFTTENSEGVVQQVLPTFPVLIGAPGAYALIGSFDWTMLLHGEQAVTLLGPVPVEGRVLVTTTVTGMWDKGSGAVVETRTDSVDAVTGEPRFTTRSASFIRGAGGWGGDRGPSSRQPDPPERPPDAEVTYPTREEQALLYRLTGDRNPLHSDPAFAAGAGFPRPILHGLCTYGFTGRALLHTLAGGDPARFRSMHGRFVTPVFPGQTLTVRVWVVDEAAVFRTVNDAGEVVLAGTCEAG